MKIKNKRKFICIIQSLNLLAQTICLIFYVKTFLLAIDRIYENQDKKIDKKGHSSEDIILDKYNIFRFICFFIIIHWIPFKNVFIIL